jgi:hypothetical protein
MVALRDWRPPAAVARVRDRLRRWRELRAQYRDETRDSLDRYMWDGLATFTLFSLAPIMALPLMLPALIYYHDLTYRVPEAIVSTIPWMPLFCLAAIAFFGLCMWWVGRRLSRPDISRLGLATCLVWAAAVWSLAYSYLVVGLGLLLVEFTLALALRRQVTREPGGGLDHSPLWTR